MKQQIAVCLFGAILMFGCQKDDRLIPEKVKSNVLATTTTDDVDDISDTFNETFNGANDLNYGSPGIYFNPVEGEIQGVSYYYGKVEVKSKYRLRNLQILVTIPFQYDYKRASGRIYKIGPAEQGGGDAMLSFIGKHGDIVGEYTWGSIGAVETTSPTQTQLQTDGNVIYGADERRTIITSATGNIKIVAGFDIGIEIGEEIEQGFIVESKLHETGHHSGEVYYTLSVNPSGWTTFYPNFLKIASLNGVFYGTAKD